MRKPVTVIMTLALVLSAVVPAPLPVSPPIASAAAPTPPPTPVWDSAIESAVAVEQAFPSPPSPDDAHRKIEEARARSAMEKVLEKHLDYWGPRYRVEPVKVKVEGDWAHGVAEWQSEGKTVDGPIHVLARRSESGTWQALMPRAEGLYLEWVEELPVALVAPDLKETLITQASDSRLLEEQLKPPAFSSKVTTQTITDEKWAYSVAPVDEWRVATNTIGHPLDFANRVSLIGPRSEMVRILVWSKSPDLSLEDWVSTNTILPESNKVDTSRGAKSTVSGHDALIALPDSCIHPVIYAFIDALDRMILVEYSEDDGITTDSFEIYVRVLEAIDINRTAIQSDSGDDEDDYQTAINLDELMIPSQTCTYAAASEGCCGYPGVLRWTCSRDTSTYQHRGNCTYWASYKRRDIGDTVANTAPAGQGHAGAWAYWAYEAGCDVNRNPQAGSIMVMESGHVAYVTSVSGNTVNVTEMNWCTQCPERNWSYSSSDKWFIHNCGQCSAPSLNSPSHGHISSDHTIGFSWSPPSDCSPDGYTFRVKTVPDMESGGTTLFDEGHGGTQVTKSFGSEWENTDLYWSVRACKPCTPYNPGPWASSRRFRIEPGQPGDCSGCSSYVTNFSFHPGSPSDATSVNIDVSIKTDFPNFRAARIRVRGGSTICEHSTFNFSCTWNTRSTPDGDHCIVLEIDDNQGSSWHNPATCYQPYRLNPRPVPPPDPPVLISPSNASTFDEGQSISLSWSATGDHYYGEVWGGPAGTTSFGWQSGTSRNIGSQWAGYTYSWRVKARNAAGESGWSSTRTFTVRPAAPSNLSATAVSCSEVALQWSDNSGNEEGYKVYRNGSYIGQVGANVTSYTDTGRSPSTTYSYYVRAFRGSIHSGPSNTASVTTPACPPTANFDAWPLAGDAPLAVQFHNTSSGAITSCSWQYGDGNTGTSCNSYHGHTYAEAGSYTVRLTVTGPGGSDTRQRTGYIDVAAPPPACDPNDDQVALFADPGYGGACVTLDLGDYPDAGHLHPVGDNNVESIKVGSNALAILYELENYGGVSEVFTSYDSDLSDNAIGANRVSSVKVLPPDTENPVVDWVAPVGNHQVHTVSDEIVELEVHATDNVGVSRVTFARWDAVGEEWVDIGNVYDAPYRMSLDCTVLNYGWNQINAWAVDLSGNSSDAPLIWLDRLPPRPDLKPYAPPGYQYPVVPSSVPGTGEVNTLYAGQTTYFDWHFTNAGNATAYGDFHVELWVGDTRYIRYPYYDWGPGRVGGFDDWMITIDEPGWHTVKLIVDSDGVIEESDDSNNVWERDFYWTPAAPYFDDMESGTNGWTATGLWHHIDGSSPYHESYSGSHSWWYGQDATGDYDTGGANSGDLTSPAVYIPDSGYYLRFRSWYETETQGPDWDQRWVQISVDGGEFIDVWHFYDDVQRWWLQSPAIDLSAYAGHTVQVRFRFDTLDAMYNDYRGWYIDDFDISSTPPPSCNDTYEPNDTAADATTISYGQTLYADICPPGDYDFYQFVGSAGDKVVVNVDAQVDGSWLDSFIYLLDSDGSTVLAFNDDEPTSYDSRLGYELPRDGTYYIKVRDYWHPSRGGPDYFYSIDLLTDDTPPSAEITSPQSGAWLDPNLEVITASATDDGSGVNRVEFLWHDGDWENSQWVWLGKDEDGSDGWEFPFDTSAEPEQQGAAFYVWAFDWAGNWTGAGAWSLGIDRTAPQVSAEVHQLYGDAPFRSFWVSWWNSSDNLSGVATYDVQYRDETAGPWTDLAIGTTDVFTRFVGLDGHTYYFRARARDHAWNQSTYAGGDGDAHHTVEICDVAPDAYEVDDTPGEASWIATDGVAQARNFHTEADQDWAKFDAIGGITYTLRTSNTGGHGDTVLYLYDIDGSTLIDRNDDYPGMGLASRIDWQPPTDGIYYAKVEHWDAYAYGCTTAYDLSVGGCSRYDLNCTCQVDIADVQAVAARWRCEPGGCYEAKYDINDDGQIDVVDIMLVASRWGCGCGDECYNGGSPESAGSPNGASTDAEPSQVTAGPSASRREADDAVNLSTGVSPVDNRATLQSSRRYDPTVVRWR